MRALELKLESRVHYGRAGHPCQLLRFAEIQTVTPGAEVRLGNMQMMIVNQMLVLLENALTLSDSNSRGHAL